MTVTISLPGGEGAKSTHGIKVINDDTGEEVKEVSRIEMDFTPDNIIEAKITVAVSKIENASGIEGLVQIDQDFSGGEDEPD